MTQSKQAISGYNKEQKQTSGELPQNDQNQNTLSVFKMFTGIKDVTENMSKKLEAIKMENLNQNEILKMENIIFEINNSKGKIKGFNLQIFFENH